MAVDYQEFNIFQRNFYTSISNFTNYTRLEIKRHGFTLMNNLGKGFPALSDYITRQHGFGWNGHECKPILEALQRKFITNYKQAQVPSFIYWKTPKTKKQKTERISKKLILFDDDIKRDICSILMIDSKTYDNLKFTNIIQSTGKEFLGKTTKRKMPKR